MCASERDRIRSVVYAIAMAHRGLRESLAVVLVEIAYVTVTAGIVCRHAAESSRPSQPRCSEI